MVKTYRVLFCFLAFLSLTGCWYIEPGFEQYGSDTTRVIGYTPVYGAADQMEILLAAPRPVTDPGKIYLYGKFLLVNEKRKGIHVFDNANPADPVNLGFLRVLGNTDMAIKDGLMYADHMGSLIALSVNDFETLEEKGRLELENWNFGLHPPGGFYFECADPEKGIVVDWKKEELLNPYCYATP